MTDLGMNIDLTRWAGQVAVITGASNGIGAALVSAAVDRGMKVVLADIDPVVTDRSAALNAQGAQTVPAVLDVRDFSQVDELAARTFERWGAVRLLINNAGIVVHGRTWEVPPDEWVRLIDVNLNGVFYGMRSFLPRMLQAGERAQVLNVASIGALRTAPFSAPYGASKHACVCLTEATAKELAEVTDLITVSLVLPGPVKSRIYDSSFAVPGPAAKAWERSVEQMATQGIDPALAAERIFTGAERGDPWILTHPARAFEYSQARAVEVQEKFLPYLAR